jgi:hypothetical protein
MGFRGRDVEVVKIENDQCLVMACDSAGAIGKKELDIIQIEPYIVGRFTARVALLEVIAVGAAPKMISATISNESYPTGTEMVVGIKDELSSLNLDDLPLSISTEKNFETRQTGIGVTAVGICKSNYLRIGKSKANDLVYCHGYPKVGNEINGIDDVEIVQGVNIYELLNMEDVHEIIPIGSQGILKEIENMATSIGLKFIMADEINIDVNKSAGPSTCLIFTCPKTFEKLELNKLHYSLIGKLK